MFIINDYLLFIFYYFFILNGLFSIINLSIII